MDRYKLVEFPENLQKISPTSSFCKGPGLIQNLFTNVNGIFPKCFEGAHLKLRKKLTRSLWAGYNQTLSSVHPSNGQLAADFHNKNGEIRAALSPTGHGAVSSKVIISPSESYIMDTQLKPSRIFINENTVMHSRNKTTAAFTLTTSNLPFDIKDVDPEAVKAWNVVDNVIASLSFQIVRRLNKCWIVGGQWTIGDDLLLSVCKKINHDGIGLLVNKNKCEGFWWKRIAADFDFGLHIYCPWQTGENALMEVGGKWKYSGNQMRCFCTTEGLIGFDYGRRILQSENAHIAIKMSGLLNGNNDKFRLGFGIDVYV